MDPLANSPVFVVPHYGDTPLAWDYLDRTVRSLLAQSDAGWRAVIVDDASPDPGADDRLAGIAALDPERLHVLRQDHNGGPGSARNEGVRWAAAREAPFVLFQDSDDLADPERLDRTRRRFAEEPRTDFLYSAFEVIDEHDKPVPRDEVTPSVREILEALEAGPVQGPDAWLPIGTATGYATLTSTVAVRTGLALRHPFPHTAVSEDAHAWFRLLAGGDGLGFLPDVTAGYRIPRSTSGSASRERLGDDFYSLMLLVDLDGFLGAATAALDAGRMSLADLREAVRRFHLRQADTMAAEGRAAAAETCRALAAVHPPAAERGRAPARGVP
ncbi:glycosyltransferase family 2 protein [Streptomyces sp. TRM76323]|uniref:Glycosyltransferase family 2 protein n=1 Tax=Streptomyces tamarix TaxID=3078565 RepID=A0ABU3QJ09_9ACTN|nr:glycosyltransferase family 2 protein [Streptomyces tamarix]MDT9682414.1 glycosyltransferase family 2 protein [Streptomyces tamarix]